MATKAAENTSKIPLSFFKKSKNELKVPQTPIKILEIRLIRPQKVFAPTTYAMNRAKRPTNYEFFVQFENNTNPIFQAKNTLWVSFEDPRLTANQFEVLFLEFTNLIFSIDHHSKSDFSGKEPLLLPNTPIHPPKTNFLFKFHHQNFFSKIFLLAY